MVLKGHREIAYLYSLTMLVPLLTKQLPVCSRADSFFADRFVTLPVLAGKRSCILSRFAKHCTTQRIVCLLTVRTIFATPVPRLTYVLCLLKGGYWCLRNVGLALSCLSHFLKQNMWSLGSTWNRYKYLGFPRIRRTKNNFSYTSATLLEQVAAPNFSSGNSSKMTILPR